MSNEPADTWVFPKIATGIRGLDEVLFGGLPAGQLTLITGGPGTGKTVMGLELLYRRARSGQPGLFFTFEERKASLLAHARNMSWNLEELEKSGRLQVIQVELSNRMVPSGDFDLKGLLANLEGHIRQIGADCIVLDAVDVILNEFQDPVRERAELQRLHGWLRERGLTAVLTLKTLKEEKRLYPFLDFMADCVVHLDQRMQDQVRTRRLMVVKYRGSGFLSNEYPYVITGGGIRILPVSSVSLTPRSLGDWVSSGNDILDAHLGGGFRRESSILISGATGTGKTSLACTFSRGACRRKEKVLYFGFEESREAIVAGMQHAGIDLAPHLEDGTLMLVTAIPESRGAEEHLIRILDRIERFAPRHLIFDAISACQRFGNEKTAFDFLVRLLVDCKQKSITCLLLNQAVGTEQFQHISGFGISSLVDTLLGLDYAQYNGELHRRLLIVKSRGARHSLRYHRLNISGNGIELVDPPPAAGQG